MSRLGSTYSIARLIRSATSSGVSTAGVFTSITPRPGARQLAPGTHHVAASYPGATYFGSSSSPSKTLKVIA